MQSQKRYVKALQNEKDEYNDIIQKGDFMQSLLVYTREDFYYDNNVQVILRDDRILPSQICYLDFYKDRTYLFGISLKMNIYELTDTREFISLELRKFGLLCEFRYAIKSFTYNLSTRSPFKSITFKVSGKEICNVLYHLNNSEHIKNVFLNLNFDNSVMVRYVIDWMFQTIWNRAIYIQNSYLSESGKTSA